MAKTTITQLANELNLSLATVSRALNNHPYVKKEVKERVLALAKKHNYQPNSIASSLRRGKTKTVGIVIPRSNRHFFSNAIFSIEEVLSKAGYNTVICQSMESHEKEINNIQTLINSNVSGIIISHAKENKNIKHIQEAIDADIKVVQFDRIQKQLNTSFVKNDNLSSSKSIVLEMLKQGYRKIAFFYGSLSVDIFKERQQGYLEAHKEFGVKLDESLFFEDTLTKAQGRETIQKMLDKNTDFDAVFSCGDYSALGAYLLLKEKGYQIPQEVGIAGFANEPFTEITSPSITSVEQNSQEMGRIAAEQLIKEIENKETPPIQVTITTIPQFRESTAKNGSRVMR